MSDSVTNAFRRPLSLALGRSPILCAILLLGHCLVAISLVCALPLVPALAGMAAAAGSLWWTLGQHACRSFAFSPRGIGVEGDGRYWLLCGRTHRVVGRVAGSSFVHPWITIINLRAEGRKRALHVIILPDCVDAQDFRRLRVWLRWHARDKYSVRPE